MNPDTDPMEFLERSADRRLLGADGLHLPVAVGRPERVPVSPRRAKIVGFGATMTGLTLLGGIGLLLLGAVDALVDGFPAFAIAVFIIGLIFVSTHWGWVHVAELTANNLDVREGRPALDRNQHWLNQIEPYTHYEISTEVEEDGSIRIVRHRYRPVPSGADTFTFVCEREFEERHSEEEPAAAVTERAELLRREAARATQQERERYETAADAFQTALLEIDDERQRAEARRAASAALSEQINANLRDPPLIE